MLFVPENNSSSLMFFPGRRQKPHGRDDARQSDQRAEALSGGYRRRGSLGGRHFFIRERKRSMSDKPDLAVELGDLSFNKQGGKFFPLRSACGRAPEWTSARVAQDPLAPERLQRSQRPSGVAMPRNRRGHQSFFPQRRGAPRSELGGSGTEGYQAFRQAPDGVGGQGAIPVVLEGERSERSFSEDQDGLG